MTAATVRSYHARRGRLSPAAVAALTQLAPRYALPGADDDPLDLRLLASTCAVRRWVLEIGPGMGEATLAMAAAEPTTGIIAVEVHTRGVARLLTALEAEGIGNVRVVHGDAVELLRHRIAPGALAGIRLWFPDPWPKTRHHKRRLVRPEVVALMADRLAPGGTVHAATDWADYAAVMTEVLDAEPLLRNAFGGPAPRPTWRPHTRYEQAGIDAGHEVVDLIYERLGPP